jgi:DNA-binding NarL/FixJ family response regulator
VPKAKVQVRTRTVTIDSAAIVALVVGEGPRERIGAVLGEQRLTFDAFDSLEQLLADPPAHSPEVVLIWTEDAISSPARQLEQCRRALEPAHVALVCRGIQRWEVRAALAVGVAGVVLEDGMAETLGPCLQAVRSGQICVPREHWRQIEPPTLSTREKQILGLVVMGYMNSQIAEQLFLAESTVKSHLSSAFGKLGVRSRNEAVKLILDSERGLGMGILGLGGEPLGGAPTLAGPSRSVKASPPPATALR